MGWLWPKPEPSFRAVMSINHTGGIVEHRESIFWSVLAALNFLLARNSVAQAKGSRGNSFPIEDRWLRSLQRLFCGSR